MKTRSTRVTVFVLIMAMVVAMFGGTIFADTKANTTITISNISTDVTFSYLATREEIKSNALNDSQIAEKYNANGDAWLEQKLTAAGVGDTYPVDIVGTVTYDASAKELTFAGDATITVTLDGIKIEKTLEKSRTLPVNDVTAALVVDGTEYTATFDSATGKITCDYEAPEGVDKIDFTMSSFVADTTYEGAPAQVVYTCEGEDSVGQFIVNDVVKYEAINPVITSGEAETVVNGTDTSILAESNFANGAGTVVFTTPTPEPTETPATPTPAPTTPTTTPAAPEKETGAAGFVERLYTVALGRPSEAKGKADWIAALKNGESGADVAKGFLYSDEFLKKNLSDEDFVETLYNTFFDRHSEPTGKAAWVKVLSLGGSRDEVIDGFINSTEWANVCVNYGIVSGGTGVASIEVEPNDMIIAFVTRLYTTCLKRNPDQSGLIAWSRQLANLRETGSHAAYGFFFSEEFLNQNMSNEEYVTRLYRTFMGREPEQAGFQAWIAVLEQGASREEVFSGFADSVEFGQLCVSYGIIR